MEMEPVGQYVAGELKECKRLLSIHARLHGSCSSNCSLTESDETKQTNASLEHLAQTPNRCCSELSGEESKVEETTQQNKLGLEEIPKKDLMPSGLEGVTPGASSQQVSWSVMPGNEERGCGLLETQKNVSVGETSWVEIDQQKSDSLEPSRDTPEDLTEAYPSVDVQQKEERMNGRLRKTLDVSEQDTLLSELVLVQMTETSTNISTHQKSSTIDQHGPDVIERLKLNSKEGEEGHDYSLRSLGKVSSSPTKHKDGGNEMTEIVPEIISSLEVSWKGGVRTKERSGLGAQNLTMRQVLLMMERLYSDHPGAVWRRASRDAMEAQEDSESVKYLVYGEISFIAFAKLVEKYAPHCTSPSSNSCSSNIHNVEAPTNFTFYDLGCGAGRPVFMASLLMTNCIKSCGIEILSSMHHMNKELLELYKVEMHKWLHPLKQKQDISFLCGDFLEADWSDADIVFTNATCFGDALFEKLEVPPSYDHIPLLPASVVSVGSDGSCHWHARDYDGQHIDTDRHKVRATEILKEGCVVITVTKTFKGDAWELLERRERRMSWASAMVSVYKKKQKWKNAP